MGALPDFPLHPKQRGVSVFSSQQPLIYTYILTFKTRLHHRTYFKTDNKRAFQRTLTHFIFAMNVRNNYGGSAAQQTIRSLSTAELQNNPDEKVKK